jgi:hypothetical protein
VISTNFIASSRCSSRLVGSKTAKESGYQAAAAASTWGGCGRIFCSGFLALFCGLSGGCCCFLAYRVGLDSREASYILFRGLRDTKGALYSRVCHSSDLRKIPTSAFVLFASHFAHQMLFVIEFMNWLQYVL